MLGPLAYLLAAVKVLGEKPPKMEVVFADGQELDVQLPPLQEVGDQHEATTADLQPVACFELAQIHRCRYILIRNE